MGKGIESIQCIDGLPVRQTLGGTDAAGLRFGIVASRFNAELTDQLAHSAVSCLLECGAYPAQVELFRVPGAYEIPMLIGELARQHRFDALIALGVVVEGETPHAQMINDSTGIELLRLATQHQIPIINEIVGTRNWDQAVARCAGLRGTRGWYAAEAAVEMAVLYRTLNADSVNNP